MLKITEKSQGQCEKTVLQIEGWVSGENVDILRDTCLRYLGQIERLVLDMDGVLFIDDQGVEFLAQCPQSRLELRGGSVFIRDVLMSRGLVASSDANR